MMDSVCVCVGWGGGGGGGGGETEREREADGDWERQRMHLRSASAPHTHHHPSRTAPPVCRSFIPLTELGLWISCGKKEKQAVCTPTSISMLVCGPTLLTTGCSSTSSEMVKVASVKAATFPTVSQCQTCYPVTKQEFVILSQGSAVRVGVWLWAGWLANWGVGGVGVWL